MSERTFRAVVAFVLVGALALAVILAGSVLLPKPSAPPSGTPATPSAGLGTAPVLAPTRSPGPAFVADVLGVGQIRRGGDPGKPLVLQFTEVAFDAIPDAAGSFSVTLTDHAGDGTTVGFTGTPSVEAPGSLGATATLVGANVLLVSIVASDTASVERITIRGLGIRASTTAALGACSARLDDFAGSLASGAVSDILASPATVVASP